jgi:hypothetical protein
MIDNLVLSDHCERFRQALYNLEGWELEGVNYIIPLNGFVESPTSDSDIVDSWGSLGFISDWFLTRTKTKNIVGSSNLFSTNRTKRRRSPINRIYSISNRKVCLFSFDCDSAKRRVSSSYTWNDYLISYLSERREGRLHRTCRYYPTDEDVTSILLLSSVYVHTPNKNSRK